MINMICLSKLIKGDCLPEHDIIIILSKFDELKQIGDWLIKIE